MFGSSFQGKAVWISGHTGFKGSWLCFWLLRLGAKVHGFSLPPPTDPSLFEQLEIESEIHHEIGDVRDPQSVHRSIQNASPDFVFHLAAQSLVRLSYDLPMETFATNVMGSAHVLNALRALRKKCAAVIVTSDKCYENHEDGRDFTEDDKLGGHDPYSASKAACEIVTAAYRDSFFQKAPVAVASARAGNVIGGGDWAADRIVPDCTRALGRHEAIPVRNPHATRPWQHVLEPLGGYLWLASRLRNSSTPQMSTAFNFGPEKESNRTVGEVVEEILRHWPGEWTNRSDPGAPHEAELLMLSTAKARRLLRWRPTWDFSTTIAQTMQWYRGFHENPRSAKAVTLRQIETYEVAARDAGIAWAQAP